MNRVNAAALAGWVATLPHTVAMATVRPMLPLRQQRAVPPQKITDALLPGASPLAVTLAHYGYGAATGAIYGALMPRPGWRSGAAYGLGVWAASYLGWLPAAGLHRPANRQPAGRMAMMIVAHLAWGCALGALTAIWEHPGSRPVHPTNPRR